MNNTTCFKYYILSHLFNKLLFSLYLYIFLLFSGAGVRLEGFVVRICIAGSRWLFIENSHHYNISAPESVFFKLFLEAVKLITLGVIYCW